MVIMHQDGNHQPRRPFSMNSGQNSGTGNSGNGSAYYNRQRPGRNESQAVVQNFLGVFNQHQMSSDNNWRSRRTRVEDSPCDNNWRVRAPHPQPLHLSTSGAGTSGQPSRPAMMPFVSNQQQQSVGGEDTVDFQAAAAVEMRHQQKNVEVRCNPLTATPQEAQARMAVLKARIQNERENRMKIAKLQYDSQSQQLKEKDDWIKKREAEVLKKFMDKEPIKKFRAILDGTTPEPLPPTDIRGQLDIAQEPLPQQQKELPRIAFDDCTSKDPVPQHHNIPGVVPPTEQNVGTDTVDFKAATEIQYRRWKKELVVRSKSLILTPQDAQARMTVLKARIQNERENRMKIDKLQYESQSQQLKEKDDWIKKREAEVLKKFMDKEPIKKFRAILDGTTPEPLPPTDIRGQLDIAQEPVPQQQKKQPKIAFDDCTSKEHLPQHHNIPQILPLVEEEQQHTVTDTVENTAATRMKNVEVRCNPLTATPQEAQARMAVLKARIQNERENRMKIAKLQYESQPQQLKEKDDWIKKREAEILQKVLDENPKLKALVNSY